MIKTVTNGKNFALVGAVAVRAWNSGRESQKDDNIFRKEFPNHMSLRKLWLTAFEMGLTYV